MLGPKRVAAFYQVLLSPLLSLSHSFGSFTRNPCIRHRGVKRQLTMSAATPTDAADSDILHLYSPLLAASDATTTTLIILNTPITSPPSPLFYFLWNRSQSRICADGGANRLHDADASLVPSLVVGDLDSLRASVREHYATKSVIIKRDPDQDTNDLDKALQNCSHQSRIVVYGAFGGRFDQEMASLQALFKWQAHFPNGMWLYNDQTCACLVGGDSRRTVIHMKVPTTNDKVDDASLPCEGPTCGLIPLAGPCKSITTHGFKWNLSNQATEFGGLVSTSNHMVGDSVSIESSTPLIFTAEVHSGSTATLW